MDMNGQPTSQNEAEISAQAMRDKTNGANIHCVSTSGSGLPRCSINVKMPKCKPPRKSDREKELEMIETVKSTFMLIANLTDEDGVIETCQEALSEMEKVFPSPNIEVRESRPDLNEQP
jgi:hypothetical protein